MAKRYCTTKYASLSLVKFQLIIATSISTFDILATSIVWPDMYMSPLMTIRDILLWFDIHLCLNFAFTLYYIISRNNMLTDYADILESYHAFRIAALSTRFHFAEAMFRICDAASY
jgi:hypothetical protein